MSTFNTQKDRGRNGKAKPHKHTNCACLTGKWYHALECCCLNLSTPGDHDWKRQYTTLRRRASDRQNIYAVLSGIDPDGINWFPDNYPDIWYY
ncbi:hypothetical protein EYW98_07485 [Escherichia coli]|uniref:hypothetical protein n=1 Tax=Escherichia sp. MOD1-EC7003 TaxID=2093900 RepID=UPI000CF76FAB|nr:hypothetical protein [Escherichia sp. MOD1-EC7003]EGO8359340.1 hypothetical protein [Escherichia coli]EGO8376674.1 hypothetical protein [Escherichia coli]EHR8834949.1 hypothetical protein [Escherichia coli]MCH0693627.1 hypothetical protein [Escherichia coli]